MNSNIRKVIFFVMVLGVSLVAYQFMIKPANEHLAASKQRVNKTLSKLKEFERATAAAEDLSKQLEELQEAIAFFESKLPPTSEIYNVLKNVTVIAQKQGLVPKAIKTLDIKNNSGYVEQPLELKLVGNFNSFYSFLLELEKLPRIMKIRQLKLNKEKDNDGQVTADMVISIFFQNKA
ncbi:MAG: type 4a pilus biogenesis protein PilO [Sedimentisphaerales bacterium]|nr:type 4a pilus biogenesis protein PilO [Sedimentisphaerales bacterium]